MAGLAASETERTRRLTIFGALLIVFMLGMGLRLYGLDADSLRLDEVKTLRHSQLDFASMISVQAKASAHPPLLYAMTHLFMVLFGDSDFAIRLQAALLGSVSVLLTYKVGEILWSRKTGVIAAFLLAISAYHLRYSQEARHYSLMVFLSLLSLILLLKALQGARWRMWGLFAICASLLIYTHYFDLLLLAGEVLFAVWVIVETWLSSRRAPPHTSFDHPASVDPGHQTAASKDQPPPADLPAPPSHRLPSARKQALCLLATITLVGMSYLPWLPFLQQQLLGRHIQFEGLGEGTVPHTELSVAFFADALREYTQVDGVPLLLLLALLVLGLISSRIRHNVLFGLWIVPPFVLPFVVRASHFFSYRYAIFVVPILLLTLARGVSVLTDLLTRRLPALREHEKARTTLLAVLTASIFGALALKPVTDYYLYESADLRGAAGYLQQTLQSDDVVLIDDVKYGTDRRVRMALSHYLSAQGAWDTPILGLGWGLGQHLSTLEQDQGRVWAVLWYQAEHVSWEDRQHASIVDFPGVLIIRPAESSGNTLQNAASTLEVLVDVMPRKEGRVDVHLALADIYMRTMRFEDAQSQLEQASVVQPDDPQGSEDMRKAKVRLFRQAYAAWDARHSFWSNVGQVLALLHHDVRISAEGPNQLVDVTLWWGTLEEMERDYTAFVHLVDQEGHILAQEDRLLLQDDLPTSYWLAGSVARKQYQLQLGSDTAPGDCLLKVGLYDWETGERLPVWDEQGRREPDDTIVVSIAQ